MNEPAEAWKPLAAVNRNAGGSLTTYGILVVLFMMVMDAR